MYPELTTQKAELAGTAIKRTIEQSGPTTISGGWPIMLLTCYEVQWSKRL